MIKRSSNRALFESSLEMKCLFSFGATLTLVILTSIYFYWRATEAQVKTQNPQTANLWATQHIVSRHSEFFQSSPAESDAYSMRPTKGGNPPAIDSRNRQDFREVMNALTRQLRRMDIECSTFRPRPPMRNPADPKTDDPAELAKYEPGGEYAAILEKAKFPVFNEDYDPKSLNPEKYDFIDSEGCYQYYEAVRFQRACGFCHGEIVDGRGNDPYAPGELLRVIHVTIPKPPAQDAAKRFWAQLLGVAIITVFFSMLAFYTVIRSAIIKPLRSLRDVAEAISRGETFKRAEIHTGDEFESLGDAFNRMLLHLVSAQEKLRKAYNDQERNVDDLAHLTIQLYETNRVKSDFMATMSHELRTPLNSILGFSDVLGSISTLTDKQKRYVDNINKSGHSLLKMINDILDMAKMESGRMEVQPGLFPIERTLGAQCDMAKPLLDKKNIDLQLQIEPDLPPMRQDESRIQQVINNLLSNAIKFTPEGGRIRIELRRVMAALSVPHAPLLRPAGTTAPKVVPMLELKVIDTGVGISEEDQGIVFEKFRQGKSVLPEGDTMKREHSGSGLGLSIVKEICKMLEGEITLESQLGVGSTFTIRLPWILEDRTRTESEMMAEIHEFSQKRIAKAAQRQEN